jgi:uncharacterized repeat protein (TIGR02543 family)
VPVQRGRHGRCGLRPRRRIRPRRSPRTAQHWYSRNQENGVITIDAAGSYTADSSITSPIVIAVSGVTLNLNSVTITAPSGKSAIALGDGVSAAIVVSGECSLTGGAGGAGICVPGTSALNLSGTGSLTAIGGGGTAGINGDGTFTADTVKTEGGAGIGGASGQANGAINISGLASLFARGCGLHASGIGTGYRHTDNGAISISDVGTLTAIGGQYGVDTAKDNGAEGGAGIGGGRDTASKTDCGTVSITGCKTVKAFGGSKAAAIGSTFWSACDVTIDSCASVEAVGGATSAAIGTARNVKSEAGDSSVVITDSAVSAQGGYYGAGIGGGYFDQSYGDYARNVKDSSGNTVSGNTISIPAVTVTIDGASTVYARGGELGAGIGGGYKETNVHVAIGARAAVTALAGEKEASGSKIPCAIGSGADGSGLFSDSNGSVSIADGASVTAFSYGYDTAEYKGTSKIDVLASKWAISRELDASDTTATVLQCRFLTSDFYSEKIGGMAELVPANPNTVTLKSAGSTYSIAVPAGYTCMAATVARGTYTVSLNGQDWSYLESQGYSATAKVGGTAYSAGSFPDEHYASYESTYNPYSGDVTVKYSFGAPSAVFAASAGVNSFDAVAYRPNTVAYTVNYDVNGGTGTYSPLTTAFGGSDLLPSAQPTRSGYTFAGWNETVGGSKTGVSGSDTYSGLVDNDAAVKSITLTAQWKKNPTIIIPQDTTPAPSPETTDIPEENVPTDETPQLNKTDHFGYIIGYPDGTVQPQGKITRAEVATIFYRLLTDESRAKYMSKTNSYSDVPASKWFNNAISTLSNSGVLKGYPDGTFRPNAPITRAEFAAIATRFYAAAGKTFTSDAFTDIAASWARNDVNYASSLGIVSGYPDGTFRPQSNITRAETVKIMNSVLERSPDKDHLLSDMLKWSDSSDVTAWYYAAIQEATNSHDYTTGTAAGYETWTKLNAMRDWAALEK